MSIYRGVIIEESLADRTVLEGVKIISTKVEAVTERHKTPWISQWTLHRVEVPERDAQAVADQIARSLDPDHAHAWYADFKNDTHHFIIFRDKVFFIDRRSKAQYDEAIQYGISLGIPEYQVDFHPDIEE